MRLTTGSRFQNFGNTFLTVTLTTVTVTLELMGLKTGHEDLEKIYYELYSTGYQSPK